MKLLVINGPNLNLLGIREPEIYGPNSYQNLVDQLKEFAQTKACVIDVLQFNSEGAIIDAIHSALAQYDGIIINPGAYTHYSYAIYDAIQAVNIPTIEVHLSNISAREPFRKTSVIAPACLGQISGLGSWSYIAAIDYFVRKDESFA